ncbi:MAG: SH3 domain-containing protein [Chloroflexi bacterium]|nr:SH3 domain-containing protein [Chloroflexota bacterium]
MTKNRFHLIAPTAFVILTLIGVAFSSRSTTLVLALQLTNTPAADSGMFITVITDEPQINVRMGPSSSIYPIVGTLLTGSTAPALGRSQGGDWIQIQYDGAPGNVGWVYSPLVQVSPGTLQIAAPPPTPVPPATPTIDPTLAAQYSIVPTSTRLPTFTPPPSLTVPSYTEISAEDSVETIPLAVVIISLAALGIIGFLLSLFWR